MDGTEIGSLRRIFEELRAASRREPYPSAEQRREHLAAVEAALIRRKDAIVAAVNSDFGGRLRHETLFAEIYVTAEAFRHSRRHLRGWMKKRRRAVPMTLMPGSAWIQPQPLGVVGIIAPWNYPLMLALSPLAGVLAAGNRALIKPSELTPRTSALIAELLAEALPADRVAVVSGGAELGAEFAALPFDHLLFTGSTRVGRMVMQAAARNLTPVTLELGGKSPALLLPDADIDSAAEDIAYGKFTNAGQTCVAPDYVLAPRQAVPGLIAALRGAVARRFQSADGAWQMSAVFGEAGRRRQSSLLAEARGRGCVVEALGPNFADLDFGPSAVLDPPPDLALSQEEIFGPILPIVSYDTPEQALDYIRDRPRPLALYVFGRGRAAIERTLRETVAGGSVVNDTLIHVAVEELPFGGVGPSGIGRYHGREGFDSFSHLKSVFERHGPRLDRLIRPPLNALHELLARFLIG